MSEHTQEGKDEEEEKGKQDFLRREEAIWREEGQTLNRRIDDRRAGHPGCDSNQDPGQLGVRGGRARNSRDSITVVATPCRTLSFLVRRLGRLHRAACTVMPPTPARRFWRRATFGSSQRGASRRSLVTKSSQSCVWHPRQAPRARMAEMGRSDATWGTYPGHGFQEELSMSEHCNR